MPLISIGRYIIPNVPYACLGYCIPFLRNNHLSWTLCVYYTNIPLLGHILFMFPLIIYTLLYLRLFVYYTNILLLGHFLFMFPLINICFVKFEINYHYQFLSCAQKYWVHRLLFISLISLALHFPLTVLLNPWTAVLGEEVTADRHRGKCSGDKEDVVGSL